MRFSLVLIATLFLISGCSPGTRDFYSFALKNPSKSVKVLSCYSEFVDNLFKREYAWLLDVSGEKSWKKEVTAVELGGIDSKPDDEETYKRAYLPGYLISKFSKLSIDSSQSRLFYAGSSGSRDHYILCTPDENIVIYYIAPR